ncbi:hypothetical protein [Absidia glauca]|uniref:Ndc10 domain-containing protein n=1 Tax=Absidia glauca TaxID=4829 RepID=A0A163J6U4_ABSGL|nr:hypothetical protein [Absidia glauca]
MEQHNDKRRYLTNLPRKLVQSMAGMPTYGRFFYIAHAALNPPTSLCKKLFPAIGEWHDRLVAKELSPGDPIQPTVAENAFVQVIMMLRKNFYTRLGAHDGFPPLLSHMTTFNLL